MTKNVSGDLIVNIGECIASLRHTSILFVRGGLAQIISYDAFDRRMNIIR